MVKDISAQEVEIGNAPESALGVHASGSTQSTTKNRFLQYFWLTDWTKFADIDSAYDIRNGTHKGR